MRQAAKNASRSASVRSSADSSLFQQQRHAPPGRPGERQRPLAVGHSERALALAGPGGGVPLLLDKELSALDLTEAEREAFFAACRKALGNETER